MRYVILGAGAIGGAMGGRLFESGHDVVLVAQRCPSGRDRRAAASSLRDPTAASRFEIPSVSEPGRGRRGKRATSPCSRPRPSRANVSSSSSPSAPRPRRRSSAPRTGWRTSASRCAGSRNVQAMRVCFSATHLEPGLIEIPFAPLTGLLDLGRYPAGVDEVSEQIAADLNESTFDSIADPKVMARKYRKLFNNLANAIEAAAGTLETEAAQRLWQLAQDEAAACCEAAGIEVAPRRARRRPQGGRSGPTGSSPATTCRAAPPGRAWSATRATSRPTG